MFFGPQWCKRCCKCQKILESYGSETEFLAAKIAHEEAIVSRDAKRLKELKKSGASDAVVSLVSKWGPLTSEEAEGDVNHYSENGTTGKEAPADGASSFVAGGKLCLGKSGDVIRSDRDKGFAESDALRMNRRIHRVAMRWRKQLLVDRAHGIDDLEQELRICYWAYWIRHGHPEYDSKIQDWARGIMRKWGYRGRNGKMWSNERIAREISFSNHPMTREFDVTDEDMLDAASLGYEHMVRSGLKGDE